MTGHVTDLTKPCWCGATAVGDPEPRDHDLLADVFPDTEDAPIPVERRDAGGNLLRLWCSPDDPRWDVDMWFYPDGQLGGIRSLKPREESA